MAYITLNRENLKKNFHFLQLLFKEKGIRWAIVSKLICGNTTFLNEIVELGVDQLCDSRLINLKIIKKIAPHIETLYIKPAPIHSVAEVVKYADISFNTEFKTVKAISDEALRQGKTHRVIIMIELGELREGVLRDRVISFYEKSSALPNIEVVGVGANFSCMSGILPDRDKLNQLLLYRKLIEATFGKEMEYVSGGTSVTIPLLAMNEVPCGVNHFRIGETLFFGTDVYHGRVMEGMSDRVICLYSQIIELIRKPIIPEGLMGTNLEGNTLQFNIEDRGKKSYRAILDVGLLDVEYSDLTPTDSAIEYVGASSDMLIVNLGENPHNYKVGDSIEFRLNYMGALRLLNSRYIEKKIV